MATLVVTLFIAAPAEANKRLRIFAEFATEIQCIEALPSYIPMGASGWTWHAGRWIIWGPYEVA